MKDKFWEYFDDESREYVKTIMQVEGEYYKKAERVISPLLKDGFCVLDIGNGGIINYDYTGLEELVCADISISKKTEEVYGNFTNISFIESNIMDMNNVSDESFDVVIVQKVIHHLAEKNYKTTRNNCIKAMKECIRVLKPGGRLIVCESTVKRWFEVLEITFFGLMMKCCDLVKFDRVFQYSPRNLRNLLSKELGKNSILERMDDIGMGQNVLFLGRKFPSRIMPCSVTFFLVRKQVKNVD